MPNSNRKAKPKSSRATDIRERKTDDDHRTLTISSTGKVKSSTAITPPQQQGRKESDSRPFRHAQVHADSADPHTKPLSNHFRTVSSSSPTGAPGPSQPKVTGATTRTGQNQTSGSERNQALRDLFRTRPSHQTQKLPGSQPRDSMTEPPPSAPSKSPNPKNPATQQTSNPLDEIDLRSPLDDPDYDIISRNEAQHSSRNAQPDHASKYPKPPKPKGSSSTPSPPAGEETRGDSDPGSDGSDGESTSWRSYDFVKESEAKLSARNAQADHPGKYPELRGSRAAGGDEGKRKGLKGWFT